MKYEAPRLNKNNKISKHAVKQARKDETKQAKHSAKQAKPAKQPRAVRVITLVKFGSIIALMLASFVAGVVSVKQYDAMIDKHVSQRLEAKQAALK